MQWKLLTIILALGSYTATSAAKAAYFLSEEKVVMTEKGTLRYDQLSNGQKSALFEQFVRDNKREVLLPLLITTFLCLDLYLDLHFDLSILLRTFRQTKESP